MNQTKDSDAFRGKRNSGNWEDKAPDVMRLDAITESLAEMYTRRGNPEIDDANFGASIKSVSEISSHPLGNREWADSSRESINAMLSTMSNSGHERVADEYDWYEHGEIRRRPRRALIFAGALIGVISMGIAGYGFYTLGLNEAVIVVTEVDVVKKTPETTSSDARLSKAVSEIDKDLSRIVEGENAHTAADLTSEASIAPVTADSASSLKTDLQPEATLKEVLSTTGLADKRAAEPAAEPVKVFESRPDVKSASAGTIVLPAKSPETPVKTAIVPVEVSEVTVKAKSGPDEAPAMPAATTSAVPEEVTTATDGASGAAISSPAVPETPDKAPAEPVATDKVAATPDAGSVALAKAPVMGEIKPPNAPGKLAETPVEAPVLQDEASVSLNSLTKSVVLAIAALGEHSGKAIAGDNPADILRARMIQLVAAATRQGKALSDVELMLEHALAGLPGEAAPDVLKDAQGKINVKMLLSAITPAADTGR